jgi:hypothetical protein
MEMVQAKKPLKVKNGKNPDETEHVVEIPTKYKKFASLEEATTDAGSEANLLSYVNASVKADSATPVRNYKAADGTADSDVIAKASVLRENWSIKDTIRDGLSQKEKAETLDEVTKLAESGASTEEILAAIRKAREVAGVPATPAA